MFLSKKNAVYFNKPKNNDPQKAKRILAGWNDEQQDKSQNIDYSIKTQSKPIINNLLIGDDFTDLTQQVVKKSDDKQKFYLTWDELNQKTNIQCQKRIVQQMVQPGGIRIKPNQNMLGQFLKQVKGMNVHIIGSLLLSKLEANYPFQIKAKALYVIEYIIKKNDHYLSYFKAHVDKLSQFPQPQDNVDNYKKILKIILNYIGISNPTEKIYQKQVFIDPGYNDDPKSKIGNFIQQNSLNKTKKAQNKKTIIGPGQSKGKVSQQKNQNNQNNFALSDLDFISFDSNNNNNKKVDNNMNTSNNNNNNNQLTFEQLMGDISFGNPQNQQQKSNTQNNSNMNLLF